MGSMDRVVVYSTANCPKCKKLKTGLQELDIDFTETDMTSADAQTELRFNGVFTMSAPVLQAGEAFYTVEQIFSGNEIRNEILTTL